MRYESVKEGDVMRIRAAGPIERYGNETVIKVTKTMIVTANARYNKRTGIEVGYASDWWPPRLGGIEKEEVE